MTIVRPSMLKRFAYWSQAFLPVVWWWCQSVWGERSSHPPPWPGDQFSHFEFQNSSALKGKSLPGREKERVCVCVNGSGKLAFTLRSVSANPTNGQHWGKSIIFLWGNIRQHFAHLTECFVCKDRQIHRVYNLCDICSFLWTCVVLQAMWTRHICLHQYEIVKHSSSSKSHDENRYRTQTWVIFMHILLQIYKRFVNLTENWVRKTEMGSFLRHLEHPLNRNETDKRIRHVIGCLLPCPQMAG